MARPDFQTLTPMQGRPDLRLVNGTFMDREQYDTESWRIVKTYERDDGSRGAYWSAPLDGLQRWGRLCHERREASKRAWRERQEADDEWSNHVATLIEEKP